MEAKNQRKVNRYSIACSSFNCSARHSAVNSNTMAHNSKTAAMADDRVHSPGNSNAQERKKRNEKPSITVMAVIIPERNPVGTGG